VIERTVEREEGPGGKVASLGGPNCTQPSRAGRGDRSRPSKKENQWFVTVLEFGKKTSASSYGTKKLPEEENVEEVQGGKNKPIKTGTEGLL